MTAPGGQPPPYVPGSVGSSSSAGPADIWGLGEKATSPIFLGTVEGSFGGGRQAPFIARANETPMRKPPVATGVFGPQFQTALEAMQELPKLYATNRAGYIALQQKLFQAGFYGTATPQAIGIGAYNQQTVNAYRDAVLAAAQLADSKTPVTFDELLAQKNPAAGGSRAVQPGFVAQYSDPQTVAALAQRAAQTVLGRDLPTAKVQEFVKEFHAAEQRWNANQKTAQGTARTGADASVTSAPSAEAAAEAFVTRGTLGTEASGNKLADYVNVLRGMVGGDV